MTTDPANRAIDERGTGHDLRRGEKPCAAAKASVWCLLCQGAKRWCGSVWSKQKSRAASNRLGIEIVPVQPMVA
jgi:hypothetical protein